MPHDVTLLKTQKNDVFGTLSLAGLRPGEFDWCTKMVTRYDCGQTNYTISVLTHVVTGYFCEFWPSGGLNYSPGEERAVDFRQVVGGWYEIRNSLDTWVQCLKRELRAPDPWAALREDSIERLNQSALVNVALRGAGKHTAASELQEANADLTREFPDLTGAVQHSLAALECVARDHCGDHATFGNLLERYPDLFPKPLDKGIEKVWGFASEMGRHLQEGRSPSEEEAELLVGLATACCTYLARKAKAVDD